MATHLTGRDRGVSLRRLPRSAKLSVARGAGSSAEAYVRHPVATEEVERRQRWQTGTAAAAAMGVCGGSS
jgi:hypothetical protein